ncbi:MAG: radical SAM protein [Candidatus Korarchaeota archaeon]
MKKKRIIREQGGMKKRYGKCSTEIALVVPMPYRAGMSGLTVYLLQDLLNSQEDVWCERFFSDIPRSVEWNRPLSDFDVIFITLQYDRDVERAYEMIASANRDSIIIVGGPVAWINPFVIQGATFAYIGEIEPQAKQIVEALRGKSNHERICALKEIPGMIYLNEPKVGKLQKVGDMSEAWHPYIQTLPDREIVALPYYFLEGSRGCSEFCKFCLLGWTTFPRRDRSVAQIESLIDGAKKSRRNTISLIGAGLGFHPKIEEIISSIISRGYSIVPPSFNPRVITEELVSMLVRGGQRTLTISLESCERIRKICAKKITDDDIRNAISVSRGKIRRVRIYTMIGLPDERDDDVLELAKTMHSLKRNAPELHLEATISVFVPKPNTPFQWAGLIDKKEFLHRSLILRKEAGIPLSITPWEEAAFQLSVDRGQKILGALDPDTKLPADYIDTGIPKKSLLNACDL